MKNVIALWKGKRTLNFPFFSEVHRWCVCTYTSHCCYGKIKLQFWAFERSFSERKIVKMWWWYLISKVSRSITNLYPHQIPQSFQYHEFHLIAIRSAKVYYENHEVMRKEKCFVFSERDWKECARRIFLCIGSRIGSIPSLFNNTHVLISRKKTIFRQF